MEKFERKVVIDSKHQYLRNKENVVYVDKEKARQAMRYAVRQRAKRIEQEKQGKTKIQKVKKLPSLHSGNT